MIKTMLIALMLVCSLTYTSAQVRGNGARRPAAVSVQLPSDQDLVARAKSGDAKAQFEVGECYYTGRGGVKKNRPESFKWFEKAVNGGNIHAKYRLARCYDKGWGVAENFTKANSMYKEAIAELTPLAENGDGLACFYLGYSYDEGLGVIQNNVTAAQWYLKGAEAGDVDAQCAMAGCYKNGRGVTKSYTEAVKWYRLSAEQGYDNAQCSLGYCYDVGQGVPQSYTEAVKWYRLSAEQGYDVAQYNLGICYQYGRGVTKSIPDAVKWYKKAAAQGNENAKKQLRSLGY